MFAGLESISRAFDPDQPRPKAKTIRASLGPYGNAHDPVDLAGGRGIAKIELWADDSVRGIRVTNRAGVAKMSGAAKGTRQEIALANDEYIAGIYGSAYYYLRSLFLETTYGRRLGAGKLQVGYRFQTDLPAELCARLADIGASSGADFVDSINFHWEYDLEGEYPPAIASVLESSLWTPEPSPRETSKSALPHLVRPTPTQAPLAAKSKVASKASKRERAKTVKKAARPAKKRTSAKPSTRGAAARSTRKG